MNVHVSRFGSSAFGVLAAFALTVVGCGDDEDDRSQKSASSGDPNVSEVSGPVVTGCCGGAVADPAMNGLRLSLDSVVALPKADLTSKTTAYFVPFESNVISLYDSGASAWVARTVTGTASLTNAGTTANTSYDVYAYWDTTTATVLLEKVQTPVTPTLTLQDGVQVKSITELTRRYVGVVATNVAGYFEDSAKNRLVWNRNNQVPRDINGVDNMSWSLVGTSTTWREVRNSPASRVTLVSGILNGGVAGAYASVRAVEMCLVSSGTSGTLMTTGIGIDSTTAPATPQITRPSAATTTVWAHSSASYEGYLAPGRHTLSWLEVGQTGTTFYCIGYSSSPPFGQLGLGGSIVM